MTTLLTTEAWPCTSAAPFSMWHRTHGQAVHEWGFPPWVPWWVALRFGWQHWDMKPEYSPNTDEFVVRTPFGFLPVSVRDEYGTPIER